MLRIHTRDARPRALVPLALALVVASELASPARAAQAPPGGAWATHAPLQIPRQEMGAARIDQRVYVVGGQVAATPPVTATVEVYHVDFDTWAFVAPLPAPRDHAGVAAHGGRVYLFGGFSGDFHAKSQVWAYDAATNAWTPRAPLPQPRGACWAVAHGDRIYVFGGVDTNHVSQKSTFVYDPAANSWTQGADMPTQREHLNAVELGGAIYVVGGRNGGGSTSANERYDPVANSWTVRAPLPTARSAMACAALAGKIHAIGGETPVLYAVHEVYDPAVDLWTARAPMPVARHGTGAVALDDRILVPGGGLVQGFQPTAHVDAYVPGPPEIGATDCVCTSQSPCANVYAAGGCRNSTGVGGVLLAYGSASVAADDLVLLAHQMPASQNGLVYMGQAAVVLPFGDGQRCVGPGAGGFFRFAVHDSGASGAFTEGPGMIAYSAASFGPAIGPGSTWRFQGWFRDPAGPCGSGFNLTNAVALTFAP